MEAVRTSETSVDNQFTRQYNPEDSSEHHTRRRENLKSHTYHDITIYMPKCVTGLEAQAHIQIRGNTLGHLVWAS
jgi:hypothetical protein